MGGSVMPALPSEKNKESFTSIISKSVYMLVEGKDEEAFFNKFFNKNQRLEPLNLNDNIQIESIQGINNLDASIGALITRTGFEKIEILLIIRDADNSHNSSFDSVRHILHKNGLPSPNNMNDFSESGGSVTTGVYILPGKPEDITGNMLEDLCLSIPDNPLIMPYIDNYLSLITGDPNVVDPKNIHKSKLLVFLASHKDVPNTLGLGTQKNYFDLNHANLDLLVEFFAKVKTLLEDGD